MSTKLLFYISLSCGSFLGGYLPILFGADAFGYWSLISGALGGLAGIWLAWRITNF